MEKYTSQFGKQINNLKSNMEHRLIRENGNVTDWTQILEFVRDFELTDSNIGDAIFQLMLIAASLTELRGPQRKQLVINILTAWINRDYPELRVMISQLPFLIDTFVRLAKGGKRVFSRIRSRWCKCL